MRTSGIFCSEIHCSSLWEHKERGIEDDITNEEENVYTHTL
jgi:hypothetical protein